jgi:hypothetical protein
VQVFSKSVCNEGHFTLRAERVFPPYLASHCSRVSETSIMVLAGHGLPAVQVWPKSVNNEVHFTLDPN